MTHFVNSKNQKLSTEAFKLFLKNHLPPEKNKYGAFWDFDGTILEGDITDGYVHHNAETIYTGLMEYAIRHNFLKKYRGPAGIEAYQKHLREKIHNKEDAYHWVAKILSDITADQRLELEAFCKRQIGTIYAQYFFEFSKDLLSYFQNLSIRNFVISASPHLFLNQLHHFLPFAGDDIFGICHPDDEPHFPPQFHEGKTKRIQVLEKSQGLKSKIALGNSWESDGHMLEYTMQQGGIGILVHDEHMLHKMPDMRDYPLLFTLHVDRQWPQHPKKSSTLM